MNDLPRHRAPRVTLRPNAEKILAAITHVIRIAEESGRPVTQYDVLKTIFIADKMHLNKYGRPITFDNYCAMKDGPVPSLTYDFLKEAKDKLRSHDIRKLPWHREQAGKGRYIYSRPDAVRFKDVLSESDVEALEKAFIVIKDLTFGQIRKLTHEDPAYTEAWETDGPRGSYPMSYGMLFDAPDYEQAETVEYLSKHT